MSKCACGGENNPSKSKFISGERLKRHAKENNGCTVPSLHESMIWGVHCTKDGKRV